MALLVPAAARAEIAYGESLDWITVDADAVARGRVVRAGPGEVVLGELIPLRGRLGASEVAVAVPERGCLPVSLEAGERVVVFLRADGAGWAPRCAAAGAEQWIVSLDDPERAYTMTGRALGRGAEVLSHVLLASARPLAGAVRPDPSPYARFQLEQGPMRIEAEGDAAMALYAGSAVYLGIPPYADLRAGILERSRSARWSERAQAARQLANYPGLDTESRLRELLADTYASEHVADGEVVGRSWPVREAAWYALIALDADLTGLEDPTR